MLVVAASLSAAGYGVLAKRVVPGRDALSLTAVQLLVAAAIALPLAAAAAADHHSHLGHAGAGHLLAALAVGVFASVVPFLLYNAAIDRVTASVAGLVLTLVPLFGTRGVARAAQREPRHRPARGRGVRAARRRARRDDGGAESRLRRAPRERSHRAPIAAARPASASSTPRASCSTARA